MRGEITFHPFFLAVLSAPQYGLYTSNLLPTPMQYNISAVAVKALTAQLGWVLEQVLYGQLTRLSLPARVGLRETSVTVSVCVCPFSLFCLLALLGV